MKHYELNGQVFAFESDGSQDHLILPTMKAITVNERDALLNVDNEPAKDKRKREIKQRLVAIDLDGNRALRAVVLALAKGQAVPVPDKNKIDNLETEAANLRAELAAQ